MNTDAIIVVDNPRAWPLQIEGVELVAARRYLNESRFIERRGLRVFNLCRSYRYQSLGYYVSLLAEARGHKPLPKVAAIQDLKSSSILRIAADDLDDLIQSSLKPIRSTEFDLSIYLGRNLAKRYDRLSQQLFRLFPAPFLRASFGWSVRHGKWRLLHLAPIAASEIPEEHRDFVIARAREYFQGLEPRAPRRSSARFDLAILVDADASEPPSNSKALRQFLHAAEEVGFTAECIGREDFGRLAEFDALFIRETTSVNHYTYRFARRAAAEGLVVIDDPDSILKCTNKVFLAELLQRHHIATPQTLIVQRPLLQPVLDALGLPCVLKQPDSAFSRGVVRVDSPEDLGCQMRRLLHHSDLILAQQYLPTAFDWRIGIFDRKPLFACRYHMAEGHWQILRRSADGRKQDEGPADTVSLTQVPATVIGTALRAANLVGNGLYGVDLKQIGARVLVMEINDNPNIDAGIEDAVLQEELYLRIMQGLMRRVEKQKGIPRR